MNKFKLGVIAAVLPFLVIGTPPIYAQDQPPPPPPGAGAPAQAFAQPQLDQMLAPIALYPDQLLTQVLMASTYPLQIVEAQRWLQDPNNAALKGDALVAALTPIPWDPSVKALVPFPQIISNLSEHLDWTQSLGVAFVNQQNDVMNEVQVLRQKAQAAGQLRSGPQIAVQQQGPAIVIEPANPQVLYVPIYDPAVVYGPWAYPAYPPFFWPAPLGFWGPGIAVGVGFGFGFSVGFGIVAPFWGWCHPMWGGGGIYVNNVFYNRIGGPHWHGNFAGGHWNHVGPIGAGPHGFAGHGPGFGGPGYHGPGGHPGGFGAHAGGPGGHPGGPGGHPGGFGAHAGGPGGHPGGPGGHPGGFGAHAGGPGGHPGGPGGHPGGSHPAVAHGAGGHPGGGHPSGSGKEHH